MLCANLTLLHHVQVVARFESMMRSGRENRMGTIPNTKTERAASRSKPEMQFILSFGARETTNAMFISARVGRDK